MAVGAIRLRVGMTDEELNETIRAAYARLTGEEGSHASVVFFSEFDDDPRPVCDIPEVVAFARRVVDRSALLSVLEPSSNRKQITLETLAFVGGLGAMELWMLANGYPVGREEIDYDPKIVEGSLKATLASMERLGMLLNNRFVAVDGIRRHGLRHDH